MEDLLKQCKGAGVGRRHLQALGMGLGIKAWTDDFAVMLDEAQNARARVAPKLEPNSAHTCTTLEVFHSLVQFSLYNCRQYQCNNHVKQIPSV